MRLSDEQIDRAKSIDLLEYLKMYEPSELVHISGEYYSTKTNDSMRIKSGHWWRNSTGEYGKNALSYFMAVRGMDYVSAVEMLSGERAMEVPKALPQAPKKKKPFVLPERNENSKLAVKYLRQRGISKSVMAYCLENGLLYESKKFHNCVFVGYDKQRKPRYAAIRGTGKDKFAIEAEGSDKRYSFEIAPCTEPVALNLFESAIDAMSYCTLLEQNGLNWKSQHYKSLGGISMIKGQDLPPSLHEYFCHHEIKSRINICFDHDEKGIGAAKQLQFILSLEGYKSIRRPPSYGKDYNDMLMHRLREKSQGFCL